MYVNWWANELKVNKEIEVYDLGVNTLRETLPGRCWHTNTFTQPHRAGADLGETDPASPPPFWRRIYYMTLSSYCKKVLYLVSKNTKRYLKGKNIQKIRPSKFTAPYLQNITHLLTGKRFRPPSSPFWKFMYPAWEMLTHQYVYTTT